MKIAIYAIAKNEAAHVYRWYNSIKQADAIIVLDTGSTDSTVSKFEQCQGVGVNSVNMPEFRFDRARQMALNFVPNDHFAVWLDLDEVMQEGWYEKLQTILIDHPQATAVNFRLVFTENADGSPAITYDRLAAHLPGMYNWKYHAHETLVNTRPEHVVNSDILCFHKPDLDKPRDYFDLLAKSAAEFNDARSTRYYARELMYRKQFADAIPVYLHAATLEESNHLLSEIYGELGECYWGLGNHTEAKNAYIYCAWASPDIREGWSKLALYMWHTGDLYGCISACIQMSYVDTKPVAGLIRDENLYREWPDHMLAMCHNKLGNEALAQHFINRAFTLAPQNPAVVKDMLIICKIPVTQS